MAQIDLKHRYLDSKISSILSNLLDSKILFLLIGFLFTSLLISQYTFAEVLIPSQEYIGYFDYEGVYTVGGNVKNLNDYAVIPTISVTVIDGENTFTNTISHVTIPPKTDIPFKTKFPEVTGDAPVLLEAELKFVKTQKDPIPIPTKKIPTVITIQKYGFTIKKCCRYFMY